MTDYRYRWVSTRQFGEERGFRKPQPSDIQEQHAIRQGWEPVPEGEEPKHLAEQPTRFGTYEIQPLLDPAKGFGPDMRLYRMPETKALERDAYYAKLSAERLTFGQDHYLRDNSYPYVQKFVLVKGERTDHEPARDIPGFVANFPNNPDDDQYEQAECFIEDFILPGVDYHPEYMKLINDLRVKLKQIPFTDDAWAMYAKRHEGFEDDDSYIRRGERNRAAWSLMIARQYEALGETSK